MALRPEDLPKDPAALAEMVLAFDGENEDLRAEIATLKGLIFGARSERSAIICVEQLALDLERIADAQPPANDDEPESDRAGNEAAQAEAQHRRVAGASAPVRACDRAGVHALPVLHGSDASDRRGDQRSARCGFRRGCGCCARSVPNTPAAPARVPIVQAPAPARLVEGGMATTALIAHMAAAKYAWQSTLYRQAQDTRRATAWSWTVRRWRGGWGARRGWPGASTICN